MKSFSEQHNSLKVFARNRKVCGHFFGRIPPGLSAELARSPLVPATISGMLKFPASIFGRTGLLVCLLAFSACSPTYDWREVRGSNAPFIAVMPAKPATYSRPINLDGLAVTMTMTAAEVNGVVFAVGSAELPDSSKIQFALNAMKTALVRNIDGKVRQEKSLQQAGSTVPAVQIEASGLTGPGKEGEPKLMLARFIAKENRVYQVVVLGSEKDVSREAADTFLTSFKLY